MDQSIIHLMARDFSSIGWVIVKNRFSGQSIDGLKTIFKHSGNHKEAERQAIAFIKHMPERNNITHEGYKF